MFKPTPASCTRRKGLPPPLATAGDGAAASVATTLKRPSLRFFEVFDRPKAAPTDLGRRLLRLISAEPRTIDASMVACQAFLTPPTSRPPNHGFPVAKGPKGHRVTVAARALHASLGSSMSLSLGKLRLKHSLDLVRSFSCSHIACGPHLLTYTP